MTSRAGTAADIDPDRDAVLSPSEQFGGPDKHASDGESLRLACPDCKHPLSSAVDGLHTARRASRSHARVLRCEECLTTYPTADIGQVVIPWLYPNPGLAHLEWSTRLKGFLQSATNEHNRLNRLLADAPMTETGRRRLSAALVAKREHKRQVTQMLAPFELDSDVLVPGVTELLADSLPRNQRLLSYADNVFRDWAWENGENASLLSGIDGLISADPRESLGAVLTLGAGSGRLAYDVHRQFGPRLSVLLDMNPLLLALGASIMHGNAVPLYEFPIAPLDEDSVAVLRECSAPEPVSAGQSGDFQFVLGDATSPPFAPQSFDTVITPWLIDILPQNLSEFLPQINRLLPDDGLWINTGTLNFVHENPSRQYSEKEVFEMVMQCGFDIVGVDHRTVSYMKSPHSAHGRSERITSFAARKRQDVAAAECAPLQPQWLIDTGLSVPASPEMAIASSSHLLAAQVLAAIDGKRSVDAITKLVAQEYNLDSEECLLAVRRILSNLPS